MMAGARTSSRGFALPFVTLQLGWSPLDLLARPPAVGEE
jgi:hypothetical protein